MQNYNISGKSEMLKAEYKVYLWMYMFYLLKQHI